MSKGQAVIAEMRKHLGSWYLWGGIGPKRFDCSGLGYYSFPEAVGVHIPRSTFGQVDGGRGVTRGHHQAADAILLGTQSNPHHVIWATGFGDQAIHAPHTGAKVEYCSIKAKSAALGYVATRRFLPDEPRPAKYNYKRTLRQGSLPGADIAHLRKHLKMKPGKSWGPVMTLKVYRDRKRLGLPGKPRILDAAYAHKLGALFKGR